MGRIRGEILLGGGVLQGAIRKFYRGYETLALSSFPVSSTATTTTAPSAAPAPPAQKCLRGGLPRFDPTGSGRFGLACAPVPTTT